MFCTNCGNKIDKEKFCPNCGEKIEQTSEVVSEQNVDEKENVAPIVVLENNSSSNQDSNNNSYTSNEDLNKDYSNKSKIAAGLFGIFLGAFGVHNFYLGFTGKAVAQLLITILSCGVLAGVSGIWGMVEGIMALTSKEFKDAEGKILKD